MKKLSANTKARNLKVINLLLDYNDKNRGVNEDKKPYVRCQYITKSGNMCVIGQLLTTKAIDDWQKNDVTVQCMHEKLTPPEFKFCFKKGFKYIGIEILKEAQRFHDNCKYFNDKGLSLRGKERFEGLKLELEEKGLI
jgi:hypothetical protein